jgi:hypothetical protein
MFFAFDKKQGGSGGGGGLASIIKHLTMQFQGTFHKGYWPLGQLHILVMIMCTQLEERKPLWSSYVRGKN